MHAYFPGLERVVQKSMVARRFRLTVRARCGHNTKNETLL